MAVRNVALHVACAGLLIVAVPAMLAAQEIVSRREACSGVRWSTPRELRTHENHALFMYLPVIRPFHSRTLWLAERLDVVDSSLRLLLPLVTRGDSLRSAEQLTMGMLRDSAGGMTYVPMPPGLAAFPRLPRAVVDAHGVLHVVWGSAERLDSRYIETAREVWYARFDGERWSTPQLIVGPHDLFWDLANTSPLLAHGDTLHFVFSMFGGSVVLARGINGVWDTTRVGFPPDRPIMGYPSMVVTASGRIVVAAVGAAEESTSGRVIARLYATASDDGGASWSSIVPVSTLPREPVYDVRLLAETSGVLRALWFQTTDVLGRPTFALPLGGATGRVGLAESRDGGESWRDLPPSDVLEYADGFQVEQMNDSTLVVVLADRRDDRLALATWSKRWGRFAFVDAKPKPAFPVFGRDDAQRLVLSWVTERGPAKWFLSAVTTLTDCR